jgi:hypothetical protein
LVAAVLFWKKGQKEATQERGISFLERFFGQVHNAIEISAKKVHSLGLKKAKKDSKQ